MMSSQNYRPVTATSTRRDRGSLEGQAMEPEVLTVEEAADVLRISRNTAYTLARLWRETGGREGLPVIELGRNLRVPRSGLERLINGEPVTTAAEGTPRASR